MTYLAALPKIGRRQRQTAGQRDVLRGDTVEVWTVATAMTPERQRVLDAGERAQAGRFRYPADGAAFVAAHALARSMLSAFGHLAPAEWHFVKNCCCRRCKTDPVAD